MRIATLLSHIALIMLVATATAQAAQWPTLPVACLPDRVAKLDGNATNAFQAACKCPPASYCPTTYEEYVDTSKHKMPTTLVNQCCPEIKPAVCPAGTYYANQPVPADGDCNPTVCPAGTAHAGEPEKNQPGRDCGQLCPAGSKLAGQLLPSNGNCNPTANCPSGSKLAGQPVPADGNCDPQTVCPAGSTLAGQVVPADGNCNPGQQVQCPSKFYPTLNESGMATLNVAQERGLFDFSLPETIGRYTYQAGQTYNFSPYVVWFRGSGLFDFGTTYHNVVTSLASRYGYSLRKDTFNGLLWIYAPNSFFCKNGACPGGVNPFDKVYRPYTNNYNDGNKTYSQIVGALGADNLTWFSFTPLLINRLPDNLMTPAMLSAWGGDEQKAIGNPTTTQGYLKANLDPALESGAASFLQVCRDAVGEYVELERKSINGTQCAYLQCRYVYAGGSNESCLAEGTKVTLAGGKTKPVEAVKVGDVVQSYNGPHKVTAKNAYQSGLRVLYGINSSGAMITGDHPIKTTEGWKVISDTAATAYADKPGFAKTKLEVGDKIITHEGEVAVKDIMRFAKVEPVSTYNLQVEGDSDFFANDIDVKGFHKMEMHYE
ncbi:MAG: hypothetical protein ACKVOE_03535 [Rickettsiales bacterium]